MWMFCFSALPNPPYSFGDPSATCFGVYGGSRVSEDLRYLVPQVRGQRTGAEEGGGATPRAP